MDELAPRRDFPVYTDGGEEEAGADAIAPGTKEQHPIPMFEDKGRFVKGGAIGTLQLEVTPTDDPNLVECVATFEFTAYDTLTAKGILPARPRPVGPGRIPVTDATGDMRRKLNGKRAVVVEVKNPKRWSLDPP